MDLRTLIEMKKQMLILGNWKEVQRINKMIALRVRDLERKKSASLEHSITSYKRY